MDEASGGRPEDVVEDVRHPIFARLYTRLSRVMEQDIGAYRERLLQGLTGEVLEVGAGNGMNFRHYPPSVTRVLAVEPEPYLRRQAQRNAAEAPVPVEVVDGVAGELPVPDRSYDAVVCSLVLCSVRDQHAALVDVRRALRPGGELRFFEHVASSSRPVAAVQRTLDATVWPTIAGGCHAARDTAAAIGRAGFDVVELDRLRFPEGPVPTPTAPHILGRAVPR